MSPQLINGSRLFYHSLGCSVGLSILPGAKQLIDQQVPYLPFCVCLFSFSRLQNMMLK